MLKTNDHQKSTKEKFQFRKFKVALAAGDFT